MCRAHPVALLVPGVVLFVAFGAPAAAFDTLPGDADAADVVLVLVAQGLGLATVFLYSGYCEAIAHQDRVGEEVSVRAALRATAPTLPALIAASLIAGAGIVFGLALLIVPGLWLMTRWVLVSPVISVERCGPWAGLRRSSRLSRGHGRLLLVTAVTTLVLDELLSIAGERLGLWLADDRIAAHVAGRAAGQLLAGPFVGIVIAIAYARLRELERRVSPPVAVTADGSRTEGG